METFQIKERRDDFITLKSKSDLDVIYDLIQKEEDFIVEDKVNKVSEIIISRNIISKVRNGEIKLLAMEDNK